MSESMIERVARAICDRESFHGQEHWTHYVEHAKAAIEAMREPTPNMIDAGFLEWPFGVASTWQAMIDAALKEQP